MRTTRIGLLVGTVIIVVGFLLGTVGFFQTASDPGSADLADAAYRSVQLLALELDGGEAPNLLVHVARVLVPVGASVSFVSVVLLFIGDRIGVFLARRRRDHIVLCGAGEKGVRLVQRFSRGAFEGIGDRGVVVIDLEPLDSANMVACREAGAITLSADARDPSTLSKAGVERARFLVLTCGADGTNAEIAIKARELASGTDRRKALRCFAHITDATLCRLLRERELELGAATGFRLEFFNVYASAALLLLQEYPPFPASPASANDKPPRSPERSDGKEPAVDRHVAVIGLDPLGQTVVTALVRQWSLRGGRPRGLRLSLFDRGAPEKAASLGCVDPGIGACADVRAYELDRSLPSFDPAGLGAGEGGVLVDIAYVCLHDDVESLAAGLALLRSTRGRPMPIVVAMMEDSGLAALLHQQGDFENVHGFSVLDHACTADVLRGRHEDLARAIHENYRRHALESPSPSAAERTLVPWSSLPETLKRSNRRQADHVFTKLAAVGCTLAPLDPFDERPFEFEPEEVELLAKLEHERWVRERREDGWQQGFEKDVEAKVSPYLVDWNELTDDIRELDRNAVRNLPDLVALARLAIVRQHPPER